MTRIGDDGVQSLAAIIRAQVRSLAKSTVPASPAAAHLHADESKGKKRPKGGDLAAVLARRVRAIDPADPDAPRKAFQVFLESVLLAEFGEHLINDPAFHQIVEEIHLQMRSNTDLAAMMAQASAALLGK